jgi:signal transduction histidine kinase
MVTARMSIGSGGGGVTSAGADYNLRIVWTLARFVEDRFGAEALRAFAAAGGLAPADFEAPNHWVSAQAYEALLVHARGLVDSDEAFMRAGVHRIKEAYGPLRYILWATTPAAVFAQGAAQYRVMSTAGDLRLIERGATWAHMRFTSRVPFSRLACLLRHAHSTALPTFWGLPPAHLKETACVGLGDASCELHYHWYASRRWLPAVLGVALAIMAGVVIARISAVTVPLPLTLAVVGGALAFLVEGRRTERMNERTREEVMGALREVAQDGSEARRELLGMHRRQRDWTRLVEEEMAARSAALKEAVAGVNEVQSARAKTLLGVSHDLRNPLQIIQMSAEYLDGTPALKGDPEGASALGDIRQAVDRMRRMLGDLVRVTKAHREFVQMTPQRVSIPELTEGLRRRLRALVYGRDVRATVVATREAPDAVEIDPLALDRILDNLLTNAAKYTERGGIVVQVSGTRETLVLKVSDTGCGIPADALDRIFEPGGSSLRSRRGDSFGVGLSVVVQLLDQIGGRLEIVSRPGTGTTFWVHLPQVARTERCSALPAPEGRGPDALDSLDRHASPVPSHSDVRQRVSRVSAPGTALQRVVTIRKVPA